MNTEFYIIPEEVFRFGDADRHLLDHVRNKAWGHKRDDVDIVHENGVDVIIANGKGVSVFNADEIKKVSLSGWVWKLPANITLPMGLCMLNDHGGHYVICPTQNMPKDLFRGLLQELGRRSTRVNQVIRSTR